VESHNRDREEDQRYELKCARQHGVWSKYKIENLSERFGASPTGFDEPHSEGIKDIMDYMASMK
jgi:hypothetical protein